MITAYCRATRIAVILFFIQCLAVSAAHAQTIITVAGGGPANPVASANICVPVSSVTGHAGNLYVAGCNQIFQVTPQGQVTVVAGTSIGGFSGDGGLATAAQLNNPKGVFVDSTGNVFISDSGNNRIREVAATTGIISTIAGDGTAAFLGDGGVGTSAEFNNPQGISGDSSGNIFVADLGNVRIREILYGPRVVQTVAGNGIQSGGGAGDGGPATSASFAVPEGIFVDGSGNIYVADGGSGLVRKITAGIIGTVAGNGQTIPGFSGDGGFATSAQLLSPAGVFVDAVGNIFIADFGNDRIRKVVASTGKIQTIAGTGADSDSGDGGTATAATLLGPVSVFVDTTGNIFVGDSGSLREVVTSTGNIQTVVASASVGFSGDGGSATTATLFAPQGVALDASNNIFISDTANHRIREVSHATGNIQTVVGNGASGAAGTAQIEPWSIYVDGQNDIAFVEHGFDQVFSLGGSTISDTSGPISVQELVASSGVVQSESFNLLGLFPRFPTAISVDSSQNIFVSDSQSLRVVESPSGTSPYQVVAGSGIAGIVAGGDGGVATSAGLGFPLSGLFLDSAGNLFISASNRIRKVAAGTGIIETVAGNGTAGYSGDGGLATSAELSNPTGVVVDQSGNIFIADTANSRIREVVASTGNIQTVAGNGVAGFSGDGGPASSAEINHPTALAFDTGGNLYVADSPNSRIREIILASGPQATLSTTAISFGNQIINTISTPQTVTLTNNGSTTLNITAAPSIAGTSASDFVITSGTTCSANAAVPSNNSCVVNITFTPGATGARGPATLTITDNAANTFPITLTGTGTPVPIGPRAALSTPTLTFSGQIVTSKSASQSVTLSNTGDTSFSVTAAPTIAGTSASDFAIATGTTCTSGTSLAPNSSCVVNITFTPGTTGARGPATLTITDNAPSTPTVSLNGTGTDFSLGTQSGGSTSTTVNAGQTATYNLQIAPTGFSGTVALTCTDPTATTVCTIPATVTLNGTTASTFAVTVTTTARSMVPRTSPSGKHPLPINMIFAAAMGMAMLFILSQSTSRKIRPILVLATAVIVAGVFVTSCGGSYNAPTSPSGGTPAGTSTLTVTATANGVSRTTSLTLVVN